MEDIRVWLENVLQKYNVEAVIFPYITFFVFLGITIILVMSGVYITRLILLRFISKLVTRTSTKWDDYIFGPKVYKALSLIMGVAILKTVIPILFTNTPAAMAFLLKVVDIYFVYILINIVIVVLKTIQEKLSTVKSLEHKPLTSYFQLLRIILIGAALIYGVSILIGKSPIVLLSAFGAMTAVILLIFKDTILGLVASIQISAYDMVRVGDWISMPEFNADGDVLAINLNTVKIVNWDKTISTVPTYYFITESFRNWRSMQEGGGRRIQRTLKIDVNSICFVDNEMRERFKKVELIHEYIIERQNEIEQFNREKNIDTSVLVNGRHMTNIGVFREYVHKYIQSHPGIHNPADRPEMYQIVRQLASDEHGVPLEIWCFTKTVKWVEFEPIQSDIFDHFFAAASFFGLTIFQSPTGKDFRAINES